MSRELAQEEEGGRGSEFEWPNRLAVFAATVGAGLLAVWALGAAAMLARRKPPQAPAAE